MRAGDQQRGIGTEIKIALHIAHITIIAFVEPGFQVPGFIFQAFCFGNTTIVKAQPFGKLFDKCSMLGRWYDEVGYYPAKVNAFPESD